MPSRFKSLNFSNLKGTKSADVKEMSITPTSNVATSSGEEVDVIAVEVLCLTGEGLQFTVPRSTLGRSLRQLVSEQIEPRPGAKHVLLYGDAYLRLDQTLQEQGIVGTVATFSCVYVATDLHAALCCVEGLQTSQEDFALDGVTQLRCTRSGQYLYHLPRSLQDLTFHGFDQRVNSITFPSNLQNLTFGAPFNQSLMNVSLPSKLQTLTFGADFNTSLANVTLPSNLQCLTLGAKFDHSLESVVFPSGLENLTLGQMFNQGLESVSFPSSLRSLTLGAEFNQSLEHVNLPDSLESLTFGEKFNQDLQHVSFPSGLQHLMFGAQFNQTLQNVNLPDSLRTLKFGASFTETFEGVKLPSNLEKLALRRSNPAMLRSGFPRNLKSLMFGGISLSCACVY